MAAAGGDLLWLLCATGLVLLAASLAGWIMTRRRGAEDPLVSNLNDRIRAWWVMVGALALAFLAGAPGVILLFAALSAVGLREFLAIAAPPANRADRILRFLAFALVLPVQYALVWTGWYGMFAVFIPVWVFLFLPVILALGGAPQAFLARTAETQWGLMVAVFALSHLPALLLLDIPGYAGRGALLIVFVIITAQSSDVAQYIWGKLLGRRKLAPTLSPSKTWEGLIGGGLTAMALGASLWWITPFSALQAALYAGLIVAMGFFGGLVLSAIKRDRGVKDWGRLIPGHGGVIDRLDSLIFSAPVFFHLVRYGWSLT